MGADTFFRSIPSPTLGQNFIFNGNMDFFQRGTSFAAAANGQYSADRWQYAKVGAAVHTLSQSSDVPTLAQSGYASVYSLLIDCTTVDTSIAAGDVVVMQQRMEGHAWAQLQNKLVTISFWVKATKTGTSCLFLNNSGLDRSYVVEFTINATDTWEKKTVSIPLNPSGGTNAYDETNGLVVGFALLAGSNFQTTANAWNTGNFKATSNQVNHCDDVANNFRISQVKMEIGGTATLFSRAGISIGGELRLCQRYYEKTYNLGVAPGTSTTDGIQVIVPARTFSANQMQSTYKVTKRTAPTVVMYSSDGTINTVRDTSAASNVAASATLIGVSAHSGSWAANDGSSTIWHWTADAEIS